MGMRLALLSRMSKTITSSYHVNYKLRHMFYFVLILFVHVHVVRVKCRQLLCMQTACRSILKSLFLFAFTLQLHYNVVSIL